MDAGVRRNSLTETIGAQGRWLNGPKVRISGTKVLLRRMFRARRGIYRGLPPHNSDYFSQTLVASVFHLRPPKEVDTYSRLEESCLSTTPGRHLDVFEDQRKIRRKFMSFELNGKVTSLASETQAGEPPAANWHPQFPPTLLRSDNSAQRQTRLRKSMRVLRRETPVLAATPADTQNDIGFEEESMEPLTVLRDRSRDVLLAIASVGSLGWISYRWWQGR